jgi:hypothetical protein
MKAVEQKKKQEIEKIKETNKTRFAIPFVGKKYWELQLFERQFGISLKHHLHYNRL